MNTNTKIFFKVPVANNEFTLYPATIAEVTDDIYTAQLDDYKADGLTFEEGQEIFICFETRREFMQQAAQIDSVTLVDFTWKINFKTTGQPVSAERRQCYRVATLMLDMTAKVGPEDHCQLVDVSATGFSVIAVQQYDVGAVLPVILYLDDQQFDGQASIQSVRELGPGKFRYGLHGVSGESDNLDQGLKHINMSVQRLQLRRRSGATV